MQSGVSVAGLLTRVLTGYASISSGGYGWGMESMRRSLVGAPEQCRDQIVAGEDGEASMRGCIPLILLESFGPVHSRVGAGLQPRASHGNPPRERVVVAQIPSPSPTWPGRNRR